MNMARIVRATAYGSPDVLEVAELPIPEPAADGVVVQVRAAGVNPIDWKLYSGSFHAVVDEHREGAGINAALPPKLGLECAGVVVAVGSEVDDVEIGAEVIVYPVTAAYADFVEAPRSALIVKPTALGWPQAGALMLAGTTATHALHAAGVGGDDTVLVHGGSGGVGLMAIQIGAARGAKVIATAAETNHDLLRRLGATAVSYGPGLLDRVRDAAPQGVTAAVDFAGTDEALDTSLALVADRERIASITGSDRRAAAGIKLLGNGPGQDMGTEVRHAARGYLAEQAGAGALEVVIAATYPLEQAAQAHEAGLRGHAPGKLVLLPTDES
jgi:NADPH:quinone reductase-like Zn-dependent oxidoreductase